jgi:hypothetical protein
MAVKVEGPLWQHALESGLLAAGAVMTVALIAPSFGFHAWQIALAEGLIGLISALCVLRATDSMPLAFYWLCAGLWAAGWTVTAHFLGTWSKISLGMIGTGLLIFTPWGMFLWASYRAEVAQRENKMTAIGPGLELQTWRKKFEDIELPGVIPTNITPTFSGRDISLRLPVHGRTTLSVLKNSVERMETAWNMRDGAIRFSKASKLGRAEVLMHITEREVLEQLVPYPMDLVARTINEPFPIGMMENGEHAMIRFREIAALIVGVRGGGKSNLINVLIAQLAQCVDCVIWMIDLKGGRAAAPWLEPWVADGSGRTRPVLDWVATTPEEAEFMLATFNSWIDIRSRNAGGKEKVVPSPKEPAIVLVVDEMARVFGQGFGNKGSSGLVTNSTLAGLAKQAVVLGRSEAMDLILATQRGTVTMTGDGDLKSQLQLRIGLGTTTQGDAMSVFPGDIQAQKQLVRLSKIPGAGVIEHDEEIIPFKVYRMDPDAGDIRTIAEWAAKNSPAQPEQMLVTAAGAVYEDRWRVRGQELIAQVGRRQLPTDPDKEFEDIIKAGMGKTLNPVRARVREIVMGAGLAGYSPFLVGKKLEAEGYEDSKDVPPDKKLPARETINRWLLDDVEAGIFNVRQPGTGNVRYYVPPPRLVSNDETGTEG